jgi:hypothetical protein
MIRWCAECVQLKTMMALAVDVRIQALCYSSLDTGGR